MKKIMYCIFFFLSAISIANANTSTGADLAPVETNQKTIKVGIMIGQPPFSYQDDDYEFKGLAVDLWRNAADHLGLKYKLYALNTTYDGTAMEASNNNFDVVVAPLSVTYKRMSWVDYSRPYFMNYVGVAVPDFEQSKAEILFMVFVKLVGAIAVVVLLSMLVFGTTLWLIERKRNDEMPSPFGKGLLAGTWIILNCFCRADTFKPKTIIGRIIVLSWLFMSVAYLSAVSAVATSSLIMALKEQTTFSQPSDMYDKQLAIEDGSFVVDIAKNYGVKVKKVKNTLAALELLSNQSELGFMGDYFLITYTMQANKIPNVKMAPFTLSNDEYAFAYPKDSKLRPKIDEALLYLQENKTARQLCKKYIGVQYEENCVF
tara:strand:+ start:1073 stop:2194 length:1122 start_codon:yes stop_codon:yes gene_type:complete